MRYYQLKTNTYFRKYDQIGYITSATSSTDRVVDESGAIFLSSLRRFPQSIDQLSGIIAKAFGDEVTADMVKDDAIAFFDDLTQAGFIVSGSSIREVENNNTGFSYQSLDHISEARGTSTQLYSDQISTQEYLEDYFQSNPRITNFQIEITSQCNERCVHCYIPHEQKLHNIDPALYYDVLDQLHEMGVWQLTISGGEPMLHPEFNNFVKAAKEKDMYVIVLTNLTCLTEKNIQILKEGNVAAVQVSLYSMIPEHHDAITQYPGSFQKTISAIKKLIENDIPVQISCPTMKINKDDYKDVLVWANKHKLKAITDYLIMAKSNNDTSNLVNRLTPEECSEVISVILNNDKDYQDAISDDDFLELVHSNEQNSEGPICGVGIVTSCMGVNGDVYPCSGWQSFVCGNLNNQTLKDIWNDSEGLKKLRSLKKKDLVQCNSCENWAFCSPCMAKNANESSTQNPLEINSYFCKVAELNQKAVYAWRARFKNEQE